MNIKYWTGFSKRKNSTKQPTGGTDCAVVLKEDTSILQPTFIVSTIPDTVNYIQAFGRYYFVTDITRNINGSFEVSCSVDELASYKTEIASVSALVEFTSSSSEIRITDSRNKPLHSFDEVTTDLLKLSSYGFNTNGAFIIGIAGGVGGVTYYLISATGLEDFYNEVYSTNFISQIENEFYGIRDCVISCRWIPYSPAGSEEYITIAGQTLSTKAYRITSRMANIPDTSYNITYPSDGLGYGTNYLDFEPYTTGTLYLPFVGVVPLDLGVVSMSKQIRIKMSIDNYTSDVVYSISNASGDYISTYQGNCGVTIPISSTQYNAMGTATGAVSIIGGVVSTIAAVAAKNPALAVGAGLGTAGSAIGMAQSLSIHTQLNGAVSSAVSSEIGLTCRATILTRKAMETNLTAYQATSGMPYFQVATLGSLSGYIQCANASITMGGYDAEKDAINSYLNSGFYYE